MKSIERIATDVGWLPISFVNVYFVGHPGAPWALIDTGTPGSAKQILAAAAARFGGGARPEGIYLTHGHIDHRGGARALAEMWDVPVYAHAMEMPYLTGGSSYPPPDPTIGGAIAFLSRFIPAKPGNLGGMVRVLPEGEMPGLEGWRWIPTPGHAPGHVSFFRESDRLLIGGDAFATMDMDSWVGLMGGKQELARGGAPFNYDWDATRRSVQKLADLNPNVVGCGHGRPMDEAGLPERLQRFAQTFQPPRHGRYVSQAAEVDASGVVWLPPAPLDPVPIATAAALFFTGVALGSGMLEKPFRD